jgi:protein-disulfide isomerase
MTPNKPTRSEQREAARAKAREMREQHKKGEQRKKLFLRLGIVAAILGSVAIVTSVVVSGANKVELTPANFSFNDGVKIGANLEAYTKTSTPTPSATPSSGSAEVPNIIMYVDYQCPICQAFEVPNSSQIESWVSSGAATLEVHPVSFLDGQSLNSYSSRAANAAICVAEEAPNSFFKFHQILFENQPAEGTAGPDNAQLIDWAVEAGAADSDVIAECINNKSYDSWLTASTTRILNEVVPGTDITMGGTPTIIVNGQQYTWATGEELVSPARFAQFLQAATQG